MRVVAITFGEGWILTPHARKDSDETIDVFVETVMPHIERKHGLQGPLVGMGTSMGGLNLATLATLHPTLFERIVLIHPAIFKCDPHREPFLCKPGLLVSGSYSRKQWAEENPFVLLRKAQTMPCTYVTACEKDCFDLYKDTRAWSDLARSRRFRVTFNTDEHGCEHGSPNPDPILDFLRSKCVTPSSD